MPSPEEYQITLCLLLYECVCTQKAILSFGFIKFTNVDYVFGW